MRALKTVQFTWIFVGDISHTYKTLWTPPGFSESLTLLTAKTLWENGSVLSEYQDRARWF